MDACFYVVATNIEDIATCDEAWHKSVNNGWVRASDCYCTVSRYNLANKLNEIYGRGIKQGLIFAKQGNHFVLKRGETVVYRPWK